MQRAGRHDLAPPLDAQRIGLEARTGPDDHLSLKLWLRLLACSTDIETEIRRRLRAGHGMTLNRAMARAVLGGFDRAQATAVIERQLDAFEAAWGAPPDHVDGHQHVQQFAGIREALVVCLARRYGALARRPWLRVSRTPVAQRTLKSDVIAALGANALEKIAFSAGVACAEGLSGIYDFRGDEAAYAHRMTRWLATSDAGTVLMCHPGDADTGSEDPDPIAPARVREAHFLASDTFARQLAEQRVRLVRGSALYSAQA